MSKAPASTTYYTDAYGNRYDTTAPGWHDSPEHLALHGKCQRPCPLSGPAPMTYVMTLGRYHQHVELYRGHDAHEAASAPGHLGSCTCAGPSLIAIGPSPDPSFDGYYAAEFDDEAAYRAWRTEEGVPDAR